MSALIQQAVSDDEARHVDDASATIADAPKS